MDKLVKRWDGVQDVDLVLCERHGVAYQRDMRAGRVHYDSRYFEKVKAYEDTPIARAVNAGRADMLGRYVPVKQTVTNWSDVLDLGAGTGAFLRELLRRGYQNPKGSEVMEQAAVALKVANMYATNTSSPDAVTAWDSFEHLENAGGKELEDMRRGAFLFVSIPVFDDLKKIRASKHYRPGEHLYYWTRAGFVEWAALYGFRLLEESDHEVKAGRESIGAFAFRKDLPGYNDFIGFYDQMHSHGHYGSSSAELFLDEIASIVRARSPRSIIDYGCGRSDLVAHFWMDGARRIARYDPAIPRWKDMPPGEFDLGLCCDVLEHIPMLHVDRVLGEVRAKAKAVIFTISTKPSRAKLPNGNNAHVTLLTQGEWTRWIASVYGSAYLVPSKWEHELIVCAGMDPDAQMVTSSAPVPVCGCGGEMYLDSYNPGRRPVEWFMRCKVCGGVGPVAAREQDARDLWRENPVCARAA